MSRCSRDFMRKSSDVGTESADKLKWVANMVFSSSLFTPSMNFEAMAKFLSEILSSRLLLLLSSSRSSKNLSKISSSLWRLFSKTSLSPDAPAHSSRNDSAGCQRFCEHCHFHLTFPPSYSLGPCLLSCSSMRYIPVSSRGFLPQSIK